MPHPTEGLIREWLQSADAIAKRSTVLAELLVLFTVTASGLVLTTTFGGPKAVQMLFGVTTAIVFVVMLATYIYCLFKNPDLLRSESFTLRKMEIERGLLGDSRSGLLERHGESLKLPTAVASGGGGEEG